MIFGADFKAGCGTEYLFSKEENDRKLMKDGYYLFFIWLSFPHGRGHLGQYLKIRLDF